MQCGDTPLHYAACNSYLAIVTLLLDHAADVNAENYVSIYAR